MAGQRKKNPFVQWIDKHGSETIAKMLKAQMSSVQHWRRGHCWPRVEQMRLIKKLSNGSVDYIDIIEGPAATNKSLKGGRR